MKTSQLRTVAKVGMSVSMAALVLSATGSGNRHRRMAAHTWQGLALVGFSVWHYNLYPSAASARPRKRS